MPNRSWLYHTVIKHLDSFDPKRWTIFSIGIPYPREGEKRAYILVHLRSSEGKNISLRFLTPDEFYAFFSFSPEIQKNIFCFWLEAEAIIGDLLLREEIKKGPFKDLLKEVENGFKD